MHEAVTFQQKPMKTLGGKYDAVSEWWHRHHLHSTYGVPALEKALQFVQHPQYALDIGCGSGGRLLGRLEAKGCAVTGVDLSGEMLNIARSNHPGAVFHQLDFMDFTSDKLFDVILAWDSLFHLASAKQEAAVLKMCALLKEGGILLYTFGDAVGDHESLSFVMEDGTQAGRLDNDLFPYGSIGIGGNLQALLKGGCTPVHLELDQFPFNHVYVIARKGD
jgi:SAM-dependent methyltransferase